MRQSTVVAVVALVILALAVPALAQAAPTPFTIDLLGLGQMRDATGGVRVIASMRAVTSDYHPCPGAIIVAQWRGAVTGYSRTVTTRFGNGGMLSPRVVKPTGAFTLTIISVTAPSGWVWDAANSDTTITRPVH